MFRHWLATAAAIGLMMGTAFAQTDTLSSSHVNPDGSVTTSETSRTYDSTRSYRHGKPVENYQWSEDTTTVTHPAPPPPPPVVVERRTTTTRTEPAVPLPPPPITSRTTTTTTTTEPDDDQ